MRISFFFCLAMFFVLVSGGSGDGFKEKRFGWAAELNRSHPELVVGDEKIGTFYTVQH